MVFLQIQWYLGENKVIFWANAVVFWVNPVVFEPNTLVIKGEYSGILVKHKAF